MSIFSTKNFRHVVRLIVYDYFVTLVVCAVAFLMCEVFTGQSARSEWRYFLIGAALLLVISTLFRVFSGAYRSVTRYAGSGTHLRLFLADFAAGVVAFVLLTVLYPSEAYAYLLYVPLAAAVSDASALASRFVYQLIYRRVKGKEESRTQGAHKVGIAIVGAGTVGAMLAVELLYNPKSRYQPVCFFEHDPTKIGSFICGLPIYDEDDDLEGRVRSLPIAEIVIALPHLQGEEAERVFKKYGALDCTVKLYDYPLRGEENTDRRVIRPFRIEDLLFRDSMQLGDSVSRSYYRDRTVLVTGGGGSIGSEICRQIAALEPKRLIIFDIYENNAYDIQQELRRKYGEKLDLCVEIGSVRERARLEAVFAYYRPEIVFHAAAHKHVPLMEHSCAEAIKNNVLGTYNTADMAEKYGTEKFILISTDKAVNPTNVMGASKRMCEMVVQCRKDSKTSFAAVRFGNVLGSNGSVIPLFRRQIEAGGPVTVTDRRIIRYFMTIPEAASLVMEAGAMAHAGELFVLDMGKPVKIYDLALNMIRLSGLVPHKDIRIEETGLRPGEKLYEELLIRTETLRKTANNTIFIEEDTPLTRAEVEEKLAVLRRAVEESADEISSPRIVEAMRAVVPTFRTPEEVNRHAAQAEEMKNVLQQ